MEFPTMKEFAKQVAEMAKDQITVNDMPIMEFALKVNEVVGYLDSEIKRTEMYMKDEYNNVFDGVDVGVDNQLALNKRHIWFCKNILRMLGVENNGE